MTEYNFLSERNKRSKKQAKAQLRIEGETVGYAEIANRLGITRAAATNRMRRLRGASGSITWERLRGISA